MLATKHNVCKTYLGRLSELGLVPEKTLFFQRRQTSGLKSYLKDTLKAVKNKTVDVVYFQKKRSKSANQLVDKSLLKQLSAYCTQHDLPVPNYDHSFSDLLKNHPDVSSVTAPNINNAAVIEAIKKCPQEFVIFCGGGLLRREILSLPKRFIHLHPGIVPDVKGADCILWSSLVRGKIGMSSFFMNTGIDTGDILLTQEYEIPQFTFDPAIEVDHKHLADSIVRLVDPVYRADLLGKLFSNNHAPGTWKSTKQNSADGKIYYFMHEDIKRITAKKWVRPE